MKFYWNTHIIFFQPGEFRHAVMAFSVERMAFLVRWDKRKLEQNYIFPSYKLYLWPLLKECIR